MAKKGKKELTDTSTTEESAMPGVTEAKVWYNDFRIHAVIVALLAFVFYWNTFQNEQALDDTVVIVNNEFVHEGFAGIPDILTKDAYFSYFNQLKSTNQLSGGRYRPLSIVSFAVEQEAFGATKKGETDSILTYGLHFEMSAPYEKRFLHEMHIRHVLNVAWYALAVVVLLYFLRYIVFRDNPLMALLAAVLFAIHPIHTEVVANVKSRDEIMSVLFICLTFILAFKYKENKGQKWWLVAGVVSFFLAFLSKEYAITLVILLPLSFYIFNKDSIKDSFISALPYYGVTLVYLMIRWNLLGPRSELSDSDIQINPYAFASGAEKLATEIATSMNYLKLLVFPHPLSSDYSYNQIPYKDFTNPVVWLSIAVHVGLVAGFIYFFKKRSVLCFAIGFYLLNLLLVNNFLFDIGATMGERLIFHSSVGFVIAVSYLLYHGAMKIKPARIRWAVAGVAMAGVVVLSGYKTIERNKDWKNDATLFLQDINVCPNSFLINVNVATSLINRSDLVTDEKQRVADLHRGVALFSKVLAMQDNYVLGYMNRTVGYLKLGEADSMVMDLDRVKILYPIHPRLPEMYYHAGMVYLSKKEYEKAETTFGKALQLNPKDPTIQAAYNEAKNAISKSTH